MIVSKFKKGDRVNTYFNGSNQKIKSVLDDGEGHVFYNLEFDDDMITVAEWECYNPEKKSVIVNKTIRIVDKDNKLVDLSNEELLDKYESLLLTRCLNDITKYKEEILIRMG